METCCWLVADLLVLHSVQTCLCCLFISVFKSVVSSLLKTFLKSVATWHLLMLQTFLVGASEVVNL